MTDKQLKKLSRGELLQMLIALTEENDVLKAELSEAQQKLADRRIICDKAGSIAEAAMELNGVFSSAQNAVQQYIENIEHINDECEKIKNDTLMQAQKEADDIIKNAEKYSKDLHCEADMYWNRVYSKTHAVLKEQDEAKAPPSDDEGN